MPHGHQVVQVRPEVLMSYDKYVRQVERLGRTGIIHAASGRSSVEPAGNEQEVVLSYYRLTGRLAASVARGS
jgi:hypothetical protein